MLIRLDLVVGIAADDVPKACEKLAKQSRSIGFGMWENSMYSSSWLVDLELRTLLWIWPF